jgi:hypothetical protein
MTSHSRHDFATLTATWNYPTTVLGLCGVVLFNPTEYSWFYAAF